MRQKTSALAFAVAVLLAVGAGGIVAADYASSDTVQPDDPSTETPDGEYDERITAEEVSEIDVDEENVTLVEDPDDGERVAVNESAGSDDGDDTDGGED